MISTRGRYALRVMIELAERCGDGYIPMKDVAERQGISLKYIERIMPMLKKAGFVESVHGKGGGYRLCLKPEEYRVGDILRVTDEDLAPVSCLSEGAPRCPRADSCRTVSMWRSFNKMTNEFFDGITLAELLNGAFDNL